jgi:hypothetical protein
MSKKAKTAALRVAYALDHHAKPLKPLVDTLRTALDESGVLHVFGHWSTGNNSNYIKLANRRVYIRGVLKPVPKIEVLDKCRGQAVYEMFNERDVLRFVASL